MYEVEQKYAVADPRAMEETLTQLGVELGEPVEQVDCYYQHPARDFSQTDEALRIRRVGERNLATYKGPKIDNHTKTRREIELPFADSAANADKLDEMLAELGFTRVIEVRKQRRTGEIALAGRRFEIAFDQVAGLGSFLEIETTADEDQLDEARSGLADVAARLHLTVAQRTSYLEMLLAAQKKTPQ